MEVIKKHTILLVILLSCTTTLPNKNVRIEKVEAAEMERVHPFLLFGEENLETLRTKKDTDPHVAKIWNAVEARANTLLTSELPEPSQGDGSRDEYRIFGDNLANLSFVYVITNNPVYATKAIEWVNAIIDNFSDWGSDLSSAHIGMGLSFFHDWLYNFEGYTDEMKTKARGSVNTRGVDVNSNEALGNHYYTTRAAEGLLSLAFQGEIPKAEMWLTETVNDFKNEHLQALHPDGWPNEGLSYDRKKEHYFLFADAYRRYAGENLMDHDFYRNNILMRLYGNTPTKYAATIHYGDSSVTDADFGYIPQISKMAREWNNGYFQKLANSIINRETPAQDLNEWPSYLFYEPTLEESPWAGLPLSHYWENGEAFVARSSWKDDAKDFVLYFRCGPPAGHKNFEEGWSSVNHAHPDCNSFTIADKGEYLATEDGHKFEGKIRLTKNHNTILVDGRGQLGDGTTGDLPDNTDTNKLHINAIDPGSFAFVEGVGYTAYPSGLFSKFDRNILYLRKGTVIIIDELASKEARDYDWLFQGDKDHRIVYEGMGVSRVIGINGAEQELKINFVGSDGLEFIMGDTGWWYFASTTASPGYKVDKLIVSPVSKKSEHTFFSVLESIGGGNIEKNIEKIEKEKLRGVKIVSSEGQDLVLFHNGESTYGDLGTDGVISYRRLLSGKVSSAFCSECTNLSANEKTLISANTKIIAIGTEYNHDKKTMKASIKEESNIYVLTLDTQDIAPSIITWNNNPKSFAYNNGKVNVTLSGSGCLLINNSTPCGFDEEESSESGVVCGNGLVETGEQCDLNNMSGATCTSLGYTEGTLSCSIRCTYEVNQCKYENPGNPGEEDPEDDTGFVFQELDGEVVLEAENFASGTVKQGIVWTIKNDPVFSNGAAMEAVPNKNKRSLKLSDGPVMSYEIKFTNSGIYYVWVRGRGPDINGDTVHVGLKGEEKANSDNMKGSTWRASLSWSKQTDDGARGIIEVKNARVETLLVGMKEDGFVVDKIILTKDPNFIPNLTGPSESIRN